MESGERIGDGSVDGFIHAKPDFVSFTIKQVDFVLVIVWSISDQF